MRCLNKQNRSYVLKMKLVQRVNVRLEEKERGCFRVVLS
jgi:hypothetical protein